LPRAQAGEEENYHTIERMLRRLLQIRPVAQKVQGDKIVIKHKDGVLKITLPKSEKAKAKEIKIKAEKPYTHPSPRLLQS